MPTQSLGKLFIGQAENEMALRQCPQNENTRNQFCLPPEPSDTCVSYDVLYVGDRGWLTFSQRNFIKRKFPYQNNFLDK